LDEALETGWRDIYGVIGMEKIADQNYFYEVTAIVLYDSQQRILLQHRTEDAPFYPGYWAFFGGRLEPGETAEQAIRRETIEELNYHLESPVLLKDYIFQRYDIRFKLYVFIEHYAKDKSELTLGEGQGWGWFSASDLVNLKTVPHDRNIIREIGRRIGWQNEDLCFCNRNL